MQSSLHIRYDACYSVLLNEFLADCGELDGVGLQELFLPLVGSDYENAKPKIVFVGQDTAGWGDMATFLADAKTNAQEALHRHQSDFDSFKFTEWMNNFGSTFLDTVLKILARLHSMGDWKQLKKRHFPEVLRSFVWANTNSIEIARPPSANAATWNALKESSALHFDHLSILLELFTPDIVIIMNWDVGEAYLGQNLKWERIGDHLDYAWDSGHQVKIFKTAHPTWLSHNKLQAQVIDQIATRCLKAG